MSGCQSRMCCCNTGQGSCSHTASASFIHTSWPAPTHFSTICNRSSHNCIAQHTRVRVTRRGRYNNDEEVRKGEEGGGEKDEEKEQHTHHGTPTYFAKGLIGPLLRCRLCRWDVAINWDAVEALRLAPRLHLDVQAKHKQLFCPIQRWRPAVLTRVHRRCTVMGALVMGALRLPHRSHEVAHCQSVLEAGKRQQQRQPDTLAGRVCTCRAD